MVLDGVEVLLCPRSQEEKQEWLECLRAAGYVSIQALTAWNGMEHLTISQNRMDSTVYCTAIQRNALTKY